MNSEIVCRSQSVSSLPGGEQFLLASISGPRCSLDLMHDFQHNGVLNFIQIQLFLVRASGLAVVFWSPVDQVGSAAGEAKEPW